MEGDLFVQTRTKRGLNWFLKLIAVKRSFSDNRAWANQFFFLYLNFFRVTGNNKTEKPQGDTIQINLVFMTG